MKTTLITLLTFFVLCSCKESQRPGQPETLEESVEAVKADQDLFYHYSIWYAFVNKVFEGTLTAAELERQGDIGLGSFNLLDGELIMLDGIIYRARQDGTVSVAEDQDKIVYANATFFDKEKSFTLKNVPDYPSLRDAINKELKSKNIFHAFKIPGEFNYIKLGGLTKQERPFKEGLDVLIPERPIFEGKNVKGTIVGFYCPDFIGQINVAGYHLHFVSNDKKLAGHVMEFDAKNLEVQMDYMSKYEFVLPESEDFYNVSLDKEFQYGNK